MTDAAGDGTVLALALPWETRTRRDYRSGLTPKAPEDTEHRIPGG